MTIKKVLDNAGTEAF